MLQYGHHMATPEHQLSGGTFQSKRYRDGTVIGETAETNLHRPVQRKRGLAITLDFRRA